MELINEDYKDELLFTFRMKDESGLSTARRMRNLSSSTGKIVMCTLDEDVHITAIPGETPIIK
jgi:hypothetical protein